MFFNTSLPSCQAILKTKPIPLHAQYQSGDEIVLKKKTYMDGITTSEKQICFIRMHRVIAYPNPDPIPQPRQKQVKKEKKAQHLQSPCPTPHNTPLPSFPAKKHDLEKYYYGGSSVGHALA